MSQCAPRLKSQDGHSAALQFHLRMLPAIVVYMTATGMAFVFGVSSFILFGLWWATSGRRGKRGQAAAGPYSPALSEESDVDEDAASCKLGSTLAQLRNAIV